MSASAACTPARGQRAARDGRFVVRRRRGSLRYECACRTCRSIWSAARCATAARSRAAERDWVVVGATRRECSHSRLRPRWARLSGVPAPRDRRGVRARAHRTQARAAAIAASLRTGPQSDARGRSRCGAISRSTRWPRRERPLIDPHGGERDLERACCAMCRRPSSRIRCACCASRASPRACALGFHVAPETLALMRTSSRAASSQRLVAERVSGGDSRALVDRAARRLREVLRECGALAAVLPESRRSSACRSPRRVTLKSIPVCTPCSRSMAARLAGCRSALRGAGARSRQGADATRQVAEPSRSRRSGRDGHRAALRTAQGASRRTRAGDPCRAAARQGPSRGGAAARDPVRAAGSDRCVASTGALRALPAGLRSRCAGTRPGC